MVSWSLSTESLPRPLFLGSDSKLGLTVDRLGAPSDPVSVERCVLFLLLLRFSVTPVTTTARRIAAVAAVANDGSTVTRYVAVRMVSVITETHLGFDVLPSFQAAKESVSPTGIVVEPIETGTWDWMKTS